MSGGVALSVVEVVSWQWSLGGSPRPNKRRLEFWCIYARYIGTPERGQGWLRSGKESFWLSGMPSVARGMTAMAAACFLHNTSRGIQQYQLRHPALAKQNPTIPTRYPTSNLRHCWGPVRWFASNCTCSKNPQMRNLWIFDQVWYGPDMEWGLVVVGVRCRPLASDIDHFPLEGRATPQSPPQNASTCHIQQPDYCQTTARLGSTR